MNKLAVTGIVVGALVFGGGAGAMITNTVAEDKLEKVEAHYQDKFAQVRLDNASTLADCHEAIRMTDQSIMDLSDYFEASNAYVANLPHPGFQLDQNLAEQTRNIRDTYLTTDRGQKIQAVKERCGYGQ